MDYCIYNVYFNILKVYIHIVISTKIHISGNILMDILFSSNIVNIPYCIFCKNGIKGSKIVSLK